MPAYLILALNLTDCLTLHSLWNSVLWGHHKWLCEWVARTAKCGDKEKQTYLMYVSLLLTYIPHCPTGLHLQYTNSKKKIVKNEG